jgi:hypothetical protein
MTVRYYYRDRARCGAEYLDQLEPGWYNRVDVERLDISVATECVIGQLYGSYNNWRNSKDCGSANFTVKHGFFVRTPKKKNWEKQTEAWKQEILARREQELAQAG